MKRKDVIVMVMLSVLVLPCSVQAQNLNWDQGINVKALVTGLKKKALKAPVATATLVNSGAAKIAQSDSMAERSDAPSSGGMGAVRSSPYTSVADHSHFRKAAVPTCTQWSTVQECVNQQVCRTVCTAGGDVAGGVSGGVGGQICSEMCSKVPQCSNVVVCSHSSGPYDN